VKLYMQPDGTWQIPGQQDRKAERIDIPNTPIELCAWLNERGVRAEPGRPIGFQSPNLLNIDQPLTPAQPKPESYGAKACRFEDEFDAMPLATQLHYAARAMENARDKL
jgi:hypothetical protein